MKKILKHVSIITLSLVLCLSLLGCELALKTREQGGQDGNANAPVFHGVEDITIEKGETFIPLEGVTVTDEEDGNINLSAVTVDAHEVNVYVEGSYTVIYTVYDSDGNKTTVERIVTVVYTDQVQPEIYGVADSNVTVGDLSFSLLKGVSAVDNLDGEVEVAVEGEVNIWVPGEYHLVYSASDAAGNEKSVQRTVTVGLGNFEFGELEDLPQNLQISGGEILASIADYSLVKFVLQVEATSADLVFGLEGATLSTAAVHVEGTQEVVIYARFEAPLENAQCSVTSSQQYQITSAKYGFAAAGDHEAPVFTRSITEDIYVPTGVDAEFAKRELLRGISAVDNLDGNVTSQIVVDLLNANLNAAGEYPVLLKVSDALGNEGTYELTLNVAVPRDTHVMSDPEFNEADTTQIKVSSGAGGSTSYAIVNGEYVFTITKAGGWASGDSPYLSGINTNLLTAQHYYVFQVDVKAEVARKMQIRAGLELWTDPWIENFRDTVKYEIGTEWATIYYVFYVPAAQSSVGSNVIKFELQLGSIDWSAAENDNVVYFDNMQFYLLTNNNDLPVITIDESKPTTFVKDGEMPDFKEYFSIQDTEDGAIEVTDAMLDLSGVNMAAAGDYQVVLTVVDSNGGQSQATLDIKVIASADTEGPVISVPALVLQQLQSYMPIKEGTDLTGMFQTALGYVTITDNIDGDIEPSLDMLDLDGLVLTAPKVGTYNVKMQTQDSSGNLSNVVEFEISVYDGTAPVLVGVRNLKVYVGDTVNPLAGVCAVDSNDGVIHLALADLGGFEQFLDANGKVVGAAGEYQVSYLAKDAAGNEATANAVITVGAEAPEYHEENAQDFLALNQQLGGGNSSQITYADGMGTINYLGAQMWWASALQLKYTDKVHLVAGTTYKLVFEAKAELPRELVIYFVDGAGNKIPGFEGDGAQLTKLKLALTDEFYVFEYEFTPTSAASANSTLEFDFEWENYLLNSGVANTIQIKQIKIIAQGEAPEIPEPQEVEPIVFENFEGYDDTAELATKWAKRYDGTNYSEGFELVTVEGNKVAKFNYASDKKYLFRYIGAFPILTDEYKYIRFNAQLASEETKVEIWFYWSGSQNGLQYTPSEIKKSDGYYYVAISDWGKTASQLTGFAIGFNYKSGDVAYFDNFEFVGALPQGEVEQDKTAPVISLSAAGQQVLGAYEFIEGEDQTQVLAALAQYISIVDDVDGEIPFDATTMLNLGGLNVQNPAAGYYTIVISASDAAGNIGTLSLPITVKSQQPVEPVEYEEVLKMDFENLTSGSDFVDSHWKVEKYDGGWQTITSVQMRVRSIDGTKIVNMASGYSMSWRYTYTADAVLENISYFGIKLSNHFSGASTANVKIAAVLEDNTVLYLLGSTDDFYEFPVTTGLVPLEKELDVPVNVKGFYIVFKSALNSAYLYMDDVTFSKVKSQQEPEQPQPVEYEDVLKMDFEGLTVQTDFVDSHWKVEKYDGGWQTVTTTQMRVRAIGDTKVVNMASGYSMSMKYTYTPDAVLENISYFSIKLSNHFSGASTASVKIAVVLEDNSVVYLLGDANTFYEFHVTTGLEQFEKALDAPVNVKAFYIVFKSALNSAYLYMDDVTFAKIKE